MNEGTDLTAAFLSELEQVLMPGDFQRLQRLADDDYLGDLGMALSSIVEATLDDLVEPVEGDA